jgi:L-rhamnose mutarotase
MYQLPKIKENIIYLHPCIIHYQDWNHHHNLYSHFILGLSTTYRNYSIFLRKGKNLSHPKIRYQDLRRELRLALMLPFHFYEEWWNQH